MTSGATENRRTSPVSTAATIILIGLAGALALLASSSADRAAASDLASRSCGSVGSSVGGGYGSIRAYGLSCSAARRVVRHALRGDLNGWTLVHGTVRDEYRKGSKRITGIPLGDRPNFENLNGALLTRPSYFSSTGGAAGGAPVLRHFYAYGVPTGGQVIRPTRIVFGADGRTYLDQLQWRRWGARATVARGTYNFDSGPAGESMITTEPARVVASHLARCDGQRTYLKLKAKIHHGDGKVTIWHALPLANSWHHCRALR